MFRLTIAGEDWATPALPNTEDSEAEVWWQENGAVYAHGFTVDGQHVLQLPHIGSFRFRGDEAGVVAAPDPSVPPELLLNAYHRWVLPMAFYVRGLEVLHASAVVAGGRVVVLCGVSRVGKSTIAYGLSRRGYLLWADDAVVLEISGPCIRGVPLPFEIRLRAASISFFHAERADSSICPRQDSVDHAGGHPVSIAAVFVLSRTPDKDDGLALKAVRCSSAEAFPAMLAHACWFSLKNAERKRRMVEHYLAVAARLPVFEIRFPTGLERLGAILDVIEDTVHTVLSGS